MSARTDRRRQTGTSRERFALLLLVFVAGQIFDFFRQCAYLRELESILDSLDQKYLFAGGAGA